MTSKFLRLLIVMLAFTAPFLAGAQVTTSSITGVVKDSKGLQLTGATVEAVHQPSGSRYRTISMKGGYFTLQGLRVGGPYLVTISYSGYAPATYEGFDLLLGEGYNIPAILKEKESVLENVVVSAAKKRVVADKTGASTNIGQRQIVTLPTISRSLGDFTRLTPQSNGSSFGGRDGRYNNLQVDGANLNNNFGLSSDPLPGGGNNPISLDAIEEVSVNIAPYDVRQAGFTGAGINAITKSGTNKLKGSAYTYYRDEASNGARVGAVKLGSQARLQSNIWGATLGGAIIKNKLFFFGAYEYEARTFPGITWSPAGGSGLGNVSSISKDTLQRFSDILRTRYNYETGPYDNFESFGSKNTKILGRIDWNINQQHKVILKYNQLVSNNDVALNSASTPNGAFTGLQNRFGPNGMSYANSNYGFEDIVRNGTFELNSRFNKKFSNQLLATYTKISAIRTSPSAVFPFIDILNANGPNTAANISAGYEPFTLNNQVINDVYSIIDNFTYYAGKHTITAGVSYEYQKIGNMFMPGSQSYYVFNSLQDFAENKAPIRYSTTYSLVPGQSAVFASQVKVNQLGIYLQDEFNVSPRFKLTAGIRLDQPSFPEAPIENPAISALQLYNQDGQLTTYKNTVLPKQNFYVSPRLGFRFDAKGDKSLVVRGGTGIFTGRIPFVWLTNITQNSGMYQFGAIVNNAAALSRFTFNPDPNFHLNRGDVLLPTVAGTTAPGNLVLSDPNFKFPVLFRTNFAIDQSLGKGWLLTVEGILGKDINAVVMRNANQKAPNSTLTGPDTRPRYLAAADRRLNSAVTGSAVILENTDKGNQYNFTVQLSKSFTKGFYGSIAYTYSSATDVTSNPGSTANSVWNGNATIGTQNSLELYNSRDALPHRIVGTVSYRVEFFKKLASTFTLFWDGSHQGRFTYVSGGDLNNDGNSAAELLFVPKKATDISFVNATYAGVTYTPAQQAEAFDAYINQDKYLSKRRGQYAERFGALLPWYNRLDFKFTQDISTKIGNNKNTLQLSADILNFSNMINRNWGNRDQINQSQVLSFVSTSTTGVPSYRLNSFNNLLVNQTFRKNISTASTWSMQVGVRYIFN